jgi:hypothetical protein
MTPGHGGTGSLVRFHLLPSLKEILEEIIPPTTGEGNKKRKKTRRKCIQEIPSFSLLFFHHHEFKEGRWGAKKEGGMLNPLFNMSKSRYHQTPVG